ncbi:hypothetical protein TBR22_A08750 [Luteitalea sp. TBR-22]|uniref:hypothetical protein n=1 Tax=Luteitalea sp. TBR-22 TaxID=2802971 RepID=UPI001AF2D576|nr:hypothetical protein [Luteitalea sp. TBR-22]BCS31672.1 hypothetical protein TBR22_A08750 [Luteitalea sp. TBR-22]
MSNMDGHDWVTLHRLRFPDRVSSRERVFPTVAGPDCWMFGPHYDVGPDGMLTGVSDVWGGVGIWHSRAAAEAMVEAPGEALPWLGEAVASWHCLAVPFAHRGAVNWRGQVQKDEAIRAAPADPGGPLIVLTSAGFASRDAETMPRILRFVAGVVAVLEDYGAQPSNLRRAAFRGGFDGRDGFTWSLWHSDDGMKQAAYKPGTHRGRLDEDNAGLLSDRSSFTRLRVVRSRGDWDGEVSWAHS